MHGPVLLLALWGRPSLAATLEVCVTCTYASVGDALAVAVDGDEVTVAAGTWEVGATVTGTIAIRGEGGGLTILTLASTATSALTVSGGGR